MKKYLGLMLMVVLILAPVATLAGLTTSGEAVEGMVVRVSPDLITVISQIEDNTRMVEVEFKIVPETKLEMATSLEEINEGDVVKIDYTEEEDNKVAQIIAKVNLSEGMGEPTETSDI